MPQKTALIIAESFSDNVGDQAIAYAMRQALEDREYAVKNIDYTGKLQKSRNTSKPISNKFWRNLKHRLRLLIGFFWAIKNLPIIWDTAIKQYDLVIVGGGQLILDNSKFPLALYLWIKLLGRNNGNIYVVSCGVGESFCWIEKILIKKALRQSKGIYFRDIRSIENAQRNFGVNAKYCPDIAYYLSKNIPSKQNVNRAYVLGLSIIDYRVYIRHASEMSISPLSEADYINKWAENVVTHVRAGEHVALISTTEVDQRYSEEVFSKVQNTCGDKVSLYPKAENWNNFIIQLSSCDSLLSGRMHGLILAHISGVRPIPYLVNKKVEAFSDEYLSKSLDEILLNIDLVLNEIS